MEIETKVKINRIDDNIIETTITIKEKLTNQEFYDKWANKKIQETQIKQSLKHNEIQMENGRRQIDILTKEIEEMTKMAKDCEARI